MRPVRCRRPGDFSWSVCFARASATLRGSTGLKSTLSAALLLVASCIFPTDRGDLVEVEVTTPTLQVTLGDTARISARLLVNGNLIPNAAIAYEVTDQNTAVVSPEGVVLGVGEGQTDVIVRAARFANAAESSVTVVVSRGIVIHALAGELNDPSGLRFGETLSLEGHRLDPDSLSLITIGGVPVDVVGYIPRDTTNPDSRERLRLHVPVVNSPAELLLVHRNGGTAARSLEIVQEDVYETGAERVVIDFSSGDFRNRNLTISFVDNDWYRIITPPSDYTVFIGLRAGQSFEGGDHLFQLQNPTDRPDQIYFPYDRPEWGMATTLVLCDMRLNRESLKDIQAGSRLTMATRRSTPDTIDVVGATVFDEPLPYELSIHSGYISTLEPDQSEENDLCRDATNIAPDGSVLDLNFDTVTDFDWFDVAVGSGVSPNSFSVTQRNEVEPNDNLVGAENVTLGTLVVGDRGTATDIDYYAVDAVAGTLLDIDVRARDVGRTVLGPMFGRAEFTDMLVDVTLYDEAGNVLARNGTARSVREQWPAVGTDARIRHPITTSGRYIVSVTGESSAFGDPEFGPKVYYGIAVMAHPLVGSLEVDVTALGADSEPRLLVVEQRQGENVSLLEPEPVGPTSTYTLPVTDGRYFLVLYNRTARPAPYQLAVRLVP